MQVVPKIRIVSRKSRLALVQSDIVRQKILRLYPDVLVEIIGISTSGDEILDRPLNKIGGKGLFVKELEKHLLEKTADLAVHSMKDVPSILPQGLTLGVILERAQANDVLCSKANYSIMSLPKSARVGSSSLRRQAQILRLRNDLEVIALRGNVETRLNKLQNTEFDAIILAAAGLERLGLHAWLQQPLSTQQMLPAVGQGALGIEYRTDDTSLAEMLRPLNDANTYACVTAEREMNRILDGGCQAPVAGFAEIIGDQILLKGLVASIDGSIVYTAAHQGSVEQAVNIGKKVGEELSAQGAAAIIADLKKSGSIYG